MTSFDDYINMYSGRKVATHVSGCGWLFQVRGEEYFEKFTEMLFDIQEAVVLEEIGKLGVCEQYEVVRGCLCGPLSWRRVPSLEEFQERPEWFVRDNLLEIMDGLEEETLVYRFYDAMEIVPVYRDNPLLSDIVERQKDEVERVLGLWRENGGHPWVYVHRTVDPERSSGFYCF